MNIFSAIEAHDTRLLTEVLCRGADPNAIKPTWIRHRPLHAAVIEIEDGGPLEALDILLSFGADINATYPDIGGMTPLMIASGNELFGVARHLVNAGADPNVGSDEGDTPLQMCISGRHHDMARFLLEKGAIKTLNAGGEFMGRSPLGSAVSILDLTMADILLKAGANPMARDKDGAIPAKYIPNLSTNNTTERQAMLNLLGATH